jgi:hypothetical protein
LAILLHMVEKVITKVGWRPRWLSAVPVEMGNLLACDARAIRSDLSLLKLDNLRK